MEGNENSRPNAAAQTNQKKGRVNMSAELRQKEKIPGHTKAKKKRAKKSKVLFLEKIPPASRILRKLSEENAFYFFTSIGDYTGESVASLEEFLEKIREIDIRSLQFHLYKGDFETWIAETLEDRELATEIEHLQNLEPIGDALRNQLIFTVSKRYEQLLKPRR
jgi:hypothetical protein